MKRFLGCSMALVLLLCVVGCGATEVEPTLPEAELIITETVPTEQPTEFIEEVKWEIPGETYEIDITHEAETDFEKIAWVIYMEAGADSVCDDCRRNAHSSSKLCNDCMVW